MKPGPSQLQAVYIQGVTHWLMHRLRIVVLVQPCFEHSYTAVPA
jgi:hypothetical protein